MSSPSCHVPSRPRSYCRMIPTGRNPTEMVAVDGDTAVVRAVVREGDPLRQECTDLWLVRLDDHGRCSGSRSGSIGPGGRGGPREE